MSYPVQRVRRRHTSLREASIHANSGFIDRRVRLTYRFRLCFLRAGTRSLVDLEQPPTGPDREDFDFGTVLARDQTLKHEFRLVNSGERPLKLTGSKVNVPCCSSVGEFPSSIPPGGSGVVPVFLKAGHVAEEKRVSFDIMTDAPAESIRTLVVTARFVPEWEVQETSDRSATVRLGQASSRIYRLTGRRKDGEGRKVPTEVVAHEPLQIEAGAPAEEVESSDGIIESSRTVVVKLPARAKLGLNRESITLRWPDGRAEIQDVQWTVEPTIRLLPPTLVLKAREGITEARVEIRSEDRPFRVLQVSGSLLAGESPSAPQAALVQSLRIPLEATRAGHQSRGRGRDG